MSAVAAEKQVSSQRSYYCRPRVLRHQSSATPGYLLGLPSLLDHPITTPPLPFSLDQSLAVVAVPPAGGVIPPVSAVPPTATNAASRLSALEVGHLAVIRALNDTVSGGRLLCVVCDQCAAYLCLESNMLLMEPCHFPGILYLHATVALPSM